MRDWFPESTFLVFARTSFGDLVLGDEAGQVHFLFVHYGRHSHFKVLLWAYIDGSLQDEEHIADILGLESKRRHTSQAELDSLLSLAYDQIPYEELHEDTLAALAKSQDQYIAESALSQLFLESATTLNNEHGN